MEIICLCGHADCGETVLQPGIKSESTSQTDAGTQAARF